MADLPVKDDILPVDRWVAGREYLDALRSLGLDPEGMAWAIDRQQNFHLLIVTSLVDRIGPKAIYDVLFKAYDAAATPKTIDPWIVSLFSTRSIVGSAYVNMPEIILRDENGAVTSDQDATVIEFEGLRIRQSWAYIRSRSKVAADRQLRGWDRFVRNVEAKAA